MSCRLEIKDLDEKGRGVGEDLHVPFTYPGDVAEVQPLNRRKKTGKLLSLITRSPDRQVPPCPHFGLCGGCSWQGLKYEAQLKHKEEKVRALFGNPLPITPSDEQFYYRNRMDYAFGAGFSIGLKDGENNIINIEKCLLMSDRSNEITARLRNFVKTRNLLHHWQGIMRHVVIREGKNIDNVVLNIITSDKGPFPLEELWKEMKDIVQGITWSVNLSPADRSYGDIQRCLGQDHFLEKLAGLIFKVPVQSFFQTNIRQTEKLLSIVKDFAGLTGNEVVLDLYSGTGSIGLSLANQAKQVIGMEENVPAVELSISNARLNNIENYSALAGRVENILRPSSLAPRPDIVILDPPRPGLHKKVIAALGELKPQKIIYVSCNPHTQKLDIDGLKGFGYKVDRCQPLDMFPNTPHIENVIILTP